VEQLIFRTGDDAGIDASISRFTEARLGPSVAATLFRRTSVGVVTGVLLEDGRRVVINAHQPQQPIEVLKTVVDTQWLDHLEHRLSELPTRRRGPVAWYPAEVAVFVSVHGLPDLPGRDAILREVLEPAGS
jgi:hypothetical protein